ncbi:hypothetical protein [Streptomyces aureus]|uniref:hypothetical protein n=1 Tax=Streptomyces aureus TaxID=193461 RepID=UPI0006E17ED6|nr:hypothetical protein [Streptomyces aureus]
MRRTPRLVAPAVSAGLIGLAVVGCSAGGAPAAAVVAALPGGDSLYDATRFSEAPRDAGV